MEQTEENLIRVELRLFLDYYRNAVFSIAHRHDKKAIDEDIREATRNGRIVFKRLIGREPIDSELESLLALTRLEEQCRKFQP